MNYQQMQSNYLKNQVMSASPNKLIEMLLQAAIKNIKLAQLAIEKQELAKAHEYFIKNTKYFVGAAYVVRRKTRR